MRVCSFFLRSENPGHVRAGVIMDDRVFELSQMASVETILRAERTSGFEAIGGGHEMEDVVLRAPIARPGKILATIVNTQAMLGGPDVRLDRPRLDMKAPSTVVGPGDEVRAPGAGVRPEVELAAVVGKRISMATEEEAKAAIFGYTVLNDVTAPSDSRSDAYEAYRRDRGTGAIRKAILRGPLFRSKNHDTFCPMGPWISTPDESRDWGKVRMTTKFDGALVQDGSTSDYLFRPESIASYVSGFLTLEAGDVVSCGSVGWTPEALGDLDPTEYLLPLRGGLLELEIEDLGILRNPVSILP